VGGETEPGPQRLDVKEGLRVLGSSSEPPSTWPDLTNAIHWVVDDTWWDHRPPEASIPSILRNEYEALLIGDAVQKLLAVLDEVGPTAPEHEYTGHDAWPAVRTSCQRAYDALEANDLQQQ
jgi:hypothetical protein